MIHLLTAAGADGKILIEWNLVDWLVLNFFPDSVAMTGMLNVVGAILCMILPYLLGSIHPAILICRRVYGKDIRDYGNGDSDFNNVWGACGKKLALSVLLLEVLKSVLSVLFGIFMWKTNGGAIAGFFVIFGHMFPLFHRFKGGKGIACLGAVILTLDPLTFLIVALVFVICLFGARLLTFATVLSSLLYPLILNAFANRGLNVAMAVITALFVVYVHWENLRRMREGKEPRLEFGRKKKE
ncbi:MAG: glycerol-3-phosphate acyltransferase [Ruminococcaceae bacterium]|nr:glycerol-3-phosphate acyltransferase [Oscillospiraceae bacterium]